MSWLDWLVLAAYGGLMLGVGWYYARRNATADDYLLGGRRMPPIALGLSLFSTLVSTLSYLGTPGEMVSHGPMMITQIAAHPLIFAIWPTMEPTEPAAAETTTVSPGLGWPTCSRPK